ncbi:hypothetical protein CMUS01_02953 [Colletotrichum musicola]|uniref:Uncharacterized protein n=1 Tax=Colletotrichum musicola TaxID=2175873 RepID=A0A8H6NUF2_9PEZI|nr:hypothetical protein CMUS01_02953 [Colletotrichum musicola]
MQGAVIGSSREISESPSPRGHIHGTHAGTALRDDGASDCDTVPALDPGYIRCGLRNPDDAGYIARGFTPPSNILVWRGRSTFSTK